MNENSLIKDIGRSYIVSSFLPTALFLAVGILIFKGFMPSLFLERIVDLDTYYAGQWLIFVSFVSWLSFGLYSGIYTTVQFFEGYYFPQRIGNFLKKRLIRKYRDKRKNLEEVLNLVEVLKPVDEAERFENIEQQLEFSNKIEQAKREYLDSETEAPLNDDDILPTRLGNVLRASELYPQHKYSIPGLMLWSRLLQLLPKELKEQIEEKFNQVSFVLNSALLSYAIGLLATLAGLVRLPCQIWASLRWTALEMCVVSGDPNFFERGYNYLSPSEYLVIGIGFLIIGYGIYRISVPIAQDFGVLIRTSFDLYRFDLLRKLHQPLPSSIKEEHAFWQKITDYWIAEGQLGFQVPEINYAIREDMFDYKRPRQRQATRRKKK
ncbi:MAG: hypothetical protein QM730_14070 [Anaerolineales bacterium]